MKGRCDNENLPHYKNYGGRGISYVARWKKFENFLSDMGEPKPGQSIERINNDGDYGPDNCVWASPKQQGNNRRSNVVIAYKGKSGTISEWADRLGIQYNTLQRRFKTGWSVERALTEPVRSWNND